MFVLTPTVHEKHMSELVCLKGTLLTYICDKKDTSRKNLAWGSTIARSDCVFQFAIAGFRRAPATGYNSHGTASPK